MSPQPQTVSTASQQILRQLADCLDAIEEELKRLGWWGTQPPDLLAEVKAGRLKSYLDAPTFELWLQCVFLPNARERVAEADLPGGSSVGEMARRQYDYHSFLEEAMPLLNLLRGFDELVVAWNESRTDSAPAPAPAPGPAMSPEMAKMFADSRGLLLHWLDLLEDQLKKLGWWDGDVPVAYARWMRESFVPETRASIRMGVVPQMTGLADRAKQQLAAESWPVPDEHAQILATFDQSVTTYHTSWQLCGLPPAVPCAGAAANPPAYTGHFGLRRAQPATRPHLVVTPGQVMDFENVLAEKRREMLNTVGDVEAELDGFLESQAATLTMTVGTAEPVEKWLAEEFLPDLHQWLDRGQVPLESRVAQSAGEEWKQRGLLPRAEELLKHLHSFDAQVASWHRLSRTLEDESAAARISAAWRCIMATPELRLPLGREPDAVRFQMLLTLNRIEAELKLTGWWSATPPALPGEFANPLEYSAGHAPETALPTFQLWLQGSFLPELRERVHAADLPHSTRLRDDANRALNEESMGADKFRESRRLYRAIDEFESLLLRAWPAAVRRHSDTRRQRGLVPPSAKSSSGRQDRIAEFRDDVEEAVRLAIYELKELGWWSGNAFGVGERLDGPQEMDISGSPPFEHWLQAVYLPDILTRVNDGRMLEERRVSDYVAWECRFLEQSESAGNLLVRLEKIDHWSELANRARRGAWEG